MRSLRLALLLTRLAARPLRDRAALSYAVILMVAGVVFGPTAMHPRDLTGPATRNQGLCAALWVLWLILGATPTRVALVVPASQYLRALPAPRWVLAGVPLLHAVLLQAPWGLLWALGEGPTSGVTLSVAAAAFQALRMAGVRSALDGVALLALAPAMVPTAPAWLGLPLSLVAGAAGANAVFRRAPELAASTGWAWVRGLPILATALALLSSLTRAEPMVLLRGALLLMAGATLALLGVRNNHVVEPATMARVLLAVGTPPLGAALVSVAGAALRADRRADWLLSSLGGSRSLRIGAAALAVAAVGLVGGTAHAAVMVAGTEPVAGTRGRLLLDGALLGALLGATAASLPRWAGEGPRGADRLYGAALALLTGIAVAAGFLGEWALIASLLAALELLRRVSGATRSMPPTLRPWRPR